MEGPSQPLSDDNFDALEAQITELWGHLNAATFRFLRLIAEFDRRGGWARHGLANCAQWLNWQCGIGAVAAREKLRVARALESLPLISEAFRAGQVSYSKVRAMTRVATAQSEADLLNVALHGTAMHVERLVRRFRRVERLEEADLAATQHRSRYLQMYHDEDGSLVLNARLPAEVGAVVRKAIEAAMEFAAEQQAPCNEPGNEPGNEPCNEPGRDAESTGGVRVNVSAETFASDNDDNDNDSDGHGASRRASLEVRRADALRLLAEQFLSDDARRCPASADRYQVVVHVSAEAFAGDAVRANDSAFATEPAQAASEDGPAQDGPANPQANRHQRLVPRVCCELEDGPALAVDTARRIACDSAVVALLESPQGEPLNVGRKTRTIHPALKRALKARDGGCRFPGCDHTRFTEGHHVVHWADGGETKLSNLVTLCGRHHRLLHEGGYRLDTDDDGHFVFYRPDGQRIREAGGAPKCFRGNNFSDDALRARHADLGLVIDAATSRSRWLGEPMDDQLLIEAMWRQRYGSGAVAYNLRPA
jgi:hypothetical protein